MICAAKNSFLNISTQLSSPFSRTATEVTEFKITSPRPEEMGRHKKCIHALTNTHSVVQVQSVSKSFEKLFLKTVRVRRARGRASREKVENRNVDTEESMTSTRRESFFFHNKCNAIDSGFFFTLQVGINHRVVVGSQGCHDKF